MRSGAVKDSTPSELRSASTLSSALAILACAIAGFAFAQNADPNSAGPTKNDYRLRVLEPAEGAVITGSDLQIAVSTDIPAERDTRRDASSMPQPNVDVFIDNALRDTIKGDSGMNVVRVSNLPPGPHKIVLLARNRSGEIVDRKEMNVSLVAAARAVRGAAGRARRARDGAAEDRHEPSCARRRRDRPAARRSDAPAPAHAVLTGRPHSAAPDEARPRSSCDSACRDAASHQVQFQGQK